MTLVALPGRVPEHRKMGRRTWVRSLSPLVAGGLCLLAIPGESEAQGLLRGFSEGARAGPIRAGLPERPGGFTFCRLQYDSVRRESDGYGWSTDYPRGDLNLTLRLSELSTASISGWLDGDQGTAVVRALDPDLFQCPFLFSSDVGTAGFSEPEVVALREYFLKGGFLWVDDFWGTPAWTQWSREMAKVLPEFEIVDLPLDHPLFSIVYTVEEVPQISHMQFWRSSGGRTDERGSDSAEAHLRAILNEHGRILVLMSHNTDIADGWEREADDPAYFALFSPPAYGIGINILVWMMTH